MIFDELHTKINSVANHIEEWMADEFAKSTDFAYSSVISQLWDGKTKEGENLRPLYSEDSWFKKPGAAKRYADWKQKITPNANRDPDAPNLFVIGKYYESISTLTVNKGIETKSTISMGQDIERKYNLQYGLNHEQASELLVQIMNNTQKKIIDEITG